MTANPSTPLTRGESSALIALVLAVTGGRPERFDATMHRLYPAWLEIRAELEK